MAYLLVILATSNSAESLSTQFFSDKASCTQAGEKVIAWINKNDSRWADKAKFKCFVVSGK